MARKSFIYYLFSKNKKPLYVDAAGHVLEANDDYFKPDGQPAKLAYSPDGWKDTLVKYARNIFYWGLSRDYTVPMKFVGDGAAILRNRMLTEGVESTTYLAIAKLDRTGLPYNYYSWYLSEINFAKYVLSKTGVQAEALEGGLSKLFKAAENTTYEIPIDEDPEHINILMDGMEFDFNRTLSIIPDQQLFAVPNYYLGTIETAREGNTPDILFKDVLPQISGPYPNENWHTRCDKEQEINIKGKIKCFFNESDTFILRAEVNDGVGAGSSQYDLVNITGSPEPADTEKEFEFDETFTTPISNRVHLKIFTGSSSGSVVQITITGGEMTINYKYRHAASYIKALYPFRLLEKLVYVITDGKYTAKSDYLSAMKDIAIASGDSLRKIEGAKIKTTIRDFFKSFFARYSIGLTVHNDQLVIEPFAYFFQNDIIADLGEVDDTTLTVADDLIHNTIKAGYEKKEYSDANGKYETNQGHEWTMPITKIVKELDIKSPYRADPFGIELLRINYDQKKTTDTNSDNDTFLINITTDQPAVSANVSFVSAGNFIIIPSSLPIVVGQRLRISGSVSNNNDYTVTGVGSIFLAQIVFVDLAVTDETATVNIEFLSQGIYNLYRPAYTSVTGIPNPASAFNLELSPKKGLLKNGAYLHSILDMLDTEKIKLRSADKNSDLVTVLDGVTVTEKEDIQIGGLPAKLFRPYYFNFRTKVPVNLVELLKVNPWGKIKFTINEQAYYGFMMDGGIKPAINDAQTWKLLCAPENDLTKLYNG